jgi:hypothetical protein
MATKKAAKKKPAKKPTKKAAGTGKCVTWKIKANNTFTPDPLDGLKNGDCIMISIPSGAGFDITVDIQPLRPGSGGPVIIHS